MEYDHGTKLGESNWNDQLRKKDSAGDIEQKPRPNQNDLN